MADKRQCPSCGREVSEEFQFCPFDATPLVRKCRSCGRTWDVSFQFCPYDSTSLIDSGAPASEPAPFNRPVVSEPPAPPRPAVAETRYEAPVSEPAAAFVERPLRPAAPQPPAAEQSPAWAAPSAEHSPYSPKPTDFTFVEQVKEPGLKATLMRPSILLFIVGAIVVGFVVWYLNAKSAQELLPPTVSYSLLPNEGKTKGVPVAIKVNQLTVFLIDDPIEGEGAGRAKEVVSTLDQMIKPLKSGGDVGFKVETVNGKPAIIEVTQEGNQQKAIISVNDSDMALAGETDGNRVAAQWAERLTDAVKVFIFGEAPTFSTGTPFGESLLAMYKSAAAENRGKVSKKSLDQAFQRLPEAQRQALQAPPLSKRQQHAQNAPPARKIG